MLYAPNFPGPNDPGHVRDGDRRSGYFGAALWIGLIAGLVEVGVIAACESAGAQVSVDLLRLNRHANWMIPASSATVLAAAGAVLAALTLLGPRVSRAIAGPFLGTLAIGGILQRVPGLHVAACRAAGSSAWAFRRRGWPGASPPSPAECSDGDCPRR